MSERMVPSETPRKIGNGKRKIVALHEGGRVPDRLFSLLVRCIFAVIGRVKQPGSMFGREVANVPVSLDHRIVSSSFAKVYDPNMEGFTVD